MKFFTLIVAVSQTVHGAFTWSNARFGGGGGFVPSIVFHPTAPGVAYARTDIGGVYRLNGDDSWTPITDSIADNADWHNWGADALAVDPQKADVVYFAAGLYTNSWDPSPGAIFKSTDRGATWTSTTLKFKVGGNMPGRGMGERLAVDPKNSDIIYFGARSGNGLWKSADAGKSFAKVDAFTAVGTYIPVPSDATGYNNDIVGLSFVTFDSTSSLMNGATSRIFVGTADNATASVYMSEDAGATWKALPNQPKRFFPHKCKLSPQEGALYISYADGAGPYDGTSGAVWRFDIAGKTWTDITPVSGSDLTFGFGGLALDAKKPGTVVVATLNSWWPDAQVYRSTDSGKTWSVLWKWNNYPELTYYYGISTPKAPWIRNDFLNVDSKWIGWMIEAFEIDPHDSDHFLYGTGLTVYGGHDLTKWDTIHNITIQSLADGIEETAVLEVASAPGGSELLAAVGDISGFTFAKDKDLSSSPKATWNNPKFTSTGGVDFAGNAPAKVVRVGNDVGAKMVALSQDGGSTWALHAGADTENNGGSVSLSADGDIVLWSTASGGVVRSQAEGAFSTVPSLGSGAVIAADRRNNTYFYAGLSGSLLVSADGGKTFAKAGALTGVTSIRDIAAHPTVGGRLYVSTNAGIFYSEDFGKSLTALAGNLKDTYQIALGRGSGSTWNLYAFGTGANGARLYGSANGGSTWTDIQGDTQGFGTISGARLAGSGNVSNKVYVGTNGRGVLYGNGALVGGDSSTTISSLSTGSKTVTTSTTRLNSSTTAPSSTLLTTKTTSLAPVPVQTVGPYGRCGGSGYTGSTTCSTGYNCKVMNEFYSQCVPN